MKSIRRFIGGFLKGIGLEFKAKQKKSRPTAEEAGEGLAHLIIGLFTNFFKLIKAMLNSIHERNENKRAQLKKDSPERRHRVTGTGLEKFRIVGSKEKTG